MPVIRNINVEATAPVTAGGATGCAMAVLVGKDDGAPNFAVRHITVEPGGSTPHHSHDYEHEVVVLDGAGFVLFDGEETAIKPGDVVFVPSEHEHRFRAASDRPLRFLCVTPTRSGCGDAVPGT